MGMVSKTPGIAPDVSDKIVQEFHEAGYFMIHVFCKSPDEEVKFIAFVKAVPRIGEVIRLLNDSDCRVLNVIHKVVKDENDGSHALTQNVYAELLATE